MELYKQHIADNPKVAMIHISRDSNEDAAEEWAKKAGFPWLTVLPDKTERSGLDDYKTSNGVPEYHLIDGNGNTVAKGQNASFAKIKNLTS